MREFPPEVARYFRLLPLGINSYPKSMATAVLFNRLRAEEPRLNEIYTHHIFHVARDVTHLKDDDWIPLTVHVAAVLGMAGYKNWSSEEARKQMCKVGDAILSTSLFRAAFSFLSPSLIASRFANRYKDNFRGVEPKATQLTQTSARVFMQFEKSIFPPFYVDVYNGMFEAALARSRAETVTSHVESVTDSTSSSMFTWTLS
jgi:hypothetical protein